MNTSSSFLDRWPAPFARVEWGGVLSARPYFRRFALRALLRQLSLIIPLAVSLTTALLLAAALLRPAGALRAFLLLLYGASLAGMAALFYSRLRRSLQLPLFCAALARQDPRFRDLLSAVEISRAPEREGISEELKGRLIEEVNDLLVSERPEIHLSLGDLRSDFAPALYLSALLAALAIFPPHLAVSGWNRLFLGAGGEIFRHLSLTPRGGRVDYGQSQEIAAELFKEDVPAPVLYVKGPEGWESVPGETAGRQTVFLLHSIIRETLYKVAWKDMESPAFTLVPVEPPRLVDFSATLTYPSYTSLPPENVKGEPQIRAFRGTGVELEALATKDLARAEMSASNGMIYPVELSEGRRLKVRFDVHNPFTFQFLLTDKEGISPKEPARYAVTVREDRPPAIRLLAPTGGLLAGHEAAIPFTYECSDDMGVGAVVLRLERGESGRAERFSLKRYAPPVKEKIDGAEFHLGALRLSGGEVLKMRLEAQDNDLVSGPKTALSDVLVVEVESYEKKHAKVSEQMKGFQKDLMDLLMEQTESRLPDNDLAAVKDNPAEAAKKAEEFASKQRRTNAAAEKVEQNLKRLVSEMEQDPLSDFALWQEHSAMQEALSHLREGSMQRAERRLGESKLEEAVKDQDAAVSELERLSALSEEVAKYDRMKGVLHAADRLLEKGDRLNEKLASGKPVDREMMQLLEQTLREAQEILSQIQKQVQELPRELPDEFVNQKAVKDLEMGKMAESMDELGRALAAGDIKAALKHAQEMLRQAKAARQALAEASEQVALPGGSNLEQKSREEGDDLEKIISAQESLLGKTGALEARRKRAEFEMQKNALASLAARQRAVIAKSQKLAGEIDRRSPAPPYKNLALANLRGSLPTMEKVAGELEKGNVIFSQKWLEEIIGALGGGALGVEEYMALSRSTAPGEISEAVAFSSATGTQFRFLQGEERSILDRLRKGLQADKSVFSKEESSELDKLAGEQGRISGETRGLRKALSEMSKRSALIGPDVMDALAEAEEGMLSSGRSLSEKETAAAQGAQEKVLSALRRGQQALGESSQQFSKMKQMSSGGGQPSMIQPRGGDSGRAGFRKGEVKIPGAEEYLPPREFREEILESLKEKYPKSQENVIKDYYKKLSQ